MSFFNLMRQQKDSMLRKHFFTRYMIAKRINKKPYKFQNISEIIFRSDAYCEVPTILFMTQSVNIWIFNLSTDSPSNKPSRILIQPGANPVRSYWYKIKNEIRQTNTFQKQNHYKKIFFTSKICKSATMGCSRRLVFQKMKSFFFSLQTFAKKNEILDFQVSKVFKIDNLCFLAF